MSDSTLERPTGWTMLAVVWLIVAGAFNIVEGLTAIHRASSVTSLFLFSDVKFWGWVLLIAGVLQALAGLLVLYGHPSGYALGVGIAAAALFVWFFFLFVAPVGSLVALVMNAIVIYGLMIGSGAPVGPDY